MKVPGPEKPSGFYNYFVLTRAEGKDEGKDSSSKLRDTHTRPEQMGSKEKFWADSPQTKERLLFKLSRANTGEHWSEKVAAEVAALLAIPHAEVDMGLWQNRHVSITTSYLGKGESLVHGNELLFQKDQGYPKDDSACRTPEHTLGAIRDCLNHHKVALPDGLEGSGLDPFGAFLGYLLLDALICNTDRHHENWAAVAKRHGSKRTLKLAPSYDHASSLGRELSDDRRTQRLTTKDVRGDLQAYCNRAKSAIFLDDKTSSPLSCLEAYREACELDQRAAEYWRDKLFPIEPTDLVDILRRMPPPSMSNPARKFAHGVLDNRLRVLKSL